MPWRGARGLFGLVDPLVEVFKCLESRSRRAGERVAVSTVLEAWVRGYVGNPGCEEAEETLWLMLKFARGEDSGRGSSCGDELEKLQGRLWEVVRSKGFCEGFSWQQFSLVLERVLGVAKRLAVLEAGRAARPGTGVRRRERRARYGARHRL